MKLIIRLIFILYRKSNCPYIFFQLKREYFPVLISSCLEQMETLFFKYLSSIQPRNPILILIFYYNIRKSVFYVLFLCLHGTFLYFKSLTPFLFRLFSRNKCKVLSNVFFLKILHTLYCFPFGNIFFKTVTQNHIGSIQMHNIFITTRISHGTFFLAIPTSIPPSLCP